MQDWNEKEWALIIAGLVEKNKLTLLYKNFHNETKNKLVQKNVSAFELHGNTTSQFWGSDIDGKNQANAVIADVDIDYLLRASPKYNPYLVSRLS